MTTAARAAVRQCVFTVRLHITGTFGVLDFAHLTHDKQWNHIVRRAILAVKRDLPKYDAGFLSYYSNSQPGPDRIIAPRHGYNALYVDQFLSLYELTKDSYFLQWASRFRAYDVSNYIFSAKGSTDPVGHGPEQASGLYGNHYWSSADFPTWIEVGLHKPEYVKGLWIDGDGAKASPKDFSIQAFVDGQWETVEKVTENHESRYVSHWKKPIKTDKIRLLVESDNGNHNVALQAVMPLLVQKKYAAITNQCNNSTNNLSAATDDSDDTSMRVRCGGWLIIPIAHLGDSVSATFEGKSGATVKVEYPTSMRNWKRLRRIPANGVQKFRAPVAGFARIVFGDSLHTINNIKILERTDK